MLHIPTIPSVWSPGSGCPGRSSTGGRSSGCWSCGPSWHGHC
ncbi:hypothetical protein GBAR_LOCUS17207 [Geodia barretti]|uniref:Uncharacterized protein n=1 Tax=Geodia barretti TaxID=519541 RepID=A0AA35SIQ3_GEOBA|nr:hypothetical protein GBAR_LOCUS17207 [Geodia barretti]